MRAAPSQGSQRGVALFLALFSLSLLAFLVQRLVAHAMSLRSTSRDYREGESFRNLVRERVVPANSAQRGCEKQLISAQGLSQTWFVCSRGASPFVTLPTTSLPSPSFDYDKAFSAFIRCPSTRTMITERIFTAPVAPYSCPLSGAIPDQATLAENIVGDDLAISISRPNQIAQLGTPGSIRITGTLRLSSNTLVIAGGSLSIATLRNDTGAPLSVTLLSAHGDITLGNTIGLISVLTVGRHKISAPSTAPAINYPFPSVRAATISGIIQ